MAIQPAICSSCGGQIQVDDVDLNGFCTCGFCGTPHKVIDVITVDGLPTVKSLLMNAELLMRDGNAEKAVSVYNEVLMIKPNCHEAWWGLYLCNRYFDSYYNYQDKYGNSGPHTKAAMMNATLEKYAYRAIEYAPTAQKEIYNNAIQSEVDYINQVNSGAYDKRTKTGTAGCYIATAVYGSYSCREVVALRRYRDDFLAKHMLGRAFIKCYYAVSPTLARLIRPDSALGKRIRKLLDKKVEKLEIR